MCVFYCCQYAKMALSIGFLFLLARCLDILSQRSCPPKPCCMVQVNNQCLSQIAFHTVQYLPNIYHQGFSTLPEAQLRSQLGVPPSCSTLYALVGFVKMRDKPHPMWKEMFLHPLLGRQSTEIKGWTLSTMQYWITFEVHWALSRVRTHSVAPTFV